MNNKIITKITSGILFCTVLAYASPVLAYTKDETVYSKLDGEGNVYKQIVNDHIKNEENLSVINDLSNLLNIEKVKGDEEINKDGNKLIWNSDGKDIYYQGTTDKELPIECKIKYELNGEEINKEEIAGKSGKVKVTIEYINKDSHNVVVNGKNVTLYTPFVAVCGTIVENSGNKNIQIKNGKAVDNGDKTTLIGISMPGMKESLGISSDKINIPDKVEITMESENFELSNIIIYVTPKVLEESDINAFKDLDSIYASVKTLQDSSKMLVEGADDLKEGTDTYSDKSKEFNSAMKQVSNGINTVNVNYTDLDVGISTLNVGSKDLENGAEMLNNGIKEISDNLGDLPESINELYSGTKALNEGVNGNAGLAVGVNTLKDNLTKTTTTSITELAENAKVLKTEITKLSAEQAEITNQISTLNELKSKLSQAVDIQAMEKIITELTNRKSDIATRIQTLTDMAQKNADVISQLTPTSETNAKLQALDAGVMAVSNGTKALEENIGKLNKAAGSLPTVITELNKGSQALASGSKSLLAGTNKLSGGSKALKTGIQTLDTNANKLLNANNQLTEGAKTLSEGAKTLSEGMEKFDKEGIERIANYINKDVKDIISRIEKLKELAEEYNNFTMLEDGNNGNVKFIMITDSIKKVEDTKEEIIEDKNRITK